MSQAGSHDGNNTDADHADLASQLGTLHQNVMDIGSMLGTNNDPQGVGAAAQNTGQAVSVTQPGTATISQASKFSRVNEVKDEDMNSALLFLKKENRGKAGSKEYSKNFESATRSLDVKFGVAKHLITTAGGSASQSGNQTTDLNIQDYITSTTLRIEEGHDRCKMHDMGDILNCAQLKPAIPTNAKCEDWWDDTETNIWTSYDTITPGQARSWQYSINKKFGAENQMSDMWLQRFLYNSSTDELRRLIKKKFEELAPNTQGGFIYLYYLLNSLFSTSRETKEAMLEQIQYFRKTGLSKVVGENVELTSLNLSSLCKKLNAIGALHEDAIDDILTGFTICSYKPFGELFNTLLQNSKLDNLTVLEGITPSSTVLDIIEAILKKARLQYNKHCLGKLWLVHGKGGGSGKGGYYANPCFNCDEAHSLHDCTKPKDDARIAKNRNDYMEKKKREGRPNVPRKNNSNSKGDRSNNGDYKRKQWAAAGLHKVGNKLMMNCRDCGNNMTHGSSSHHKWAANPSAYKLSSSHPLVRHNKDLGHDVPTSGGIPPSIKSGDTVQTDLTGSTSSADSLTFSRAQIESKLDGLERNSTDPNATATAAMFRALFLN